MSLPFRWVSLVTLEIVFSVQCAPNKEFKFLCFFMRRFSAGDGLTDFNFGL